jgi:hypothetical protein
VQSQGSRSCPQFGLVAPPVASGMRTSQHNRHRAVRAQVPRPWRARAVHAWAVASVVARGAPSLAPSQGSLSRVRFSLVAPPVAGSMRAARLARHRATRARLARLWHAQAAHAWTLTSVDARMLCCSCRPRAASLPPPLSQRLSPAACGSWAARYERHRACHGQLARPRSVQHRARADACVDRSHV